MTGVPSAIVSKGLASLCAPWCNGVHEEAYTAWLAERVLPAAGGRAQPARSLPRSLAKAKGAGSPPAGVRKGASCYEPAKMLPVPNHMGSLSEKPTRRQTSYGVDGRSTFNVLPLEGGNVHGED